MACKIDLRNLITTEASNQGVDPAIALSVAQRESGTCQWTVSGAVVRGSAGEIGLFQLMPATAADLGVDAFDVNQNIRGGISYLKELYRKYGTWSQAIAAWNWGPGKVDKAIAAGTSFPDQVVNYVKGVLGIGTVYSAALNKISSTTGAQSSSPAGSSSIPVASVSDVLSSVTTGTKSPMLVAGLLLAGLLAAGIWISSN